MKLPFPKYLNFILQFCPEVQGEQETRAKLAAIGLGAGKSFVSEPASGVLVSHDLLGNDPVVSAKSCASARADVS